MLSFFGGNPVSQKGEMDLADKKKESPRVIITFNGKKHTLEEWTKQETAADKERQLNWNHAFPKNPDTADRESPYINNKPSRIKSYLRVRHVFGRKKIKWPAGGRTIRETLYPVRHFLLPAAAAIVVGLSIGLSMLLVFTGQTGPGQGAWTSGTGRSATAGQSLSPVTNQSLGLSVYVIQSGVYSTQAAAGQAAGQLRNNGAAAVTFNQGTTDIFISAASTAAGAAKLAGYFKNQGIPVYQKNIQFSASANPAVLKDGSAAAFAAQGKALMQDLLKISEEAVNNHFSPSGQALAQMDRLLNSWKLPNAGSLSSRDGQIAENFRKSAVTAASRAHAMQAKGTGTSFSTYQQSLLETIMLYRDLIAK